MQNLGLTRGENRKFYERTIGGRLDVLRNGSSWERFSAKRRNVDSDGRVKLDVLLGSADWQQGVWHVKVHWCAGFCECGWSQNPVTEI